MILNCPTMMIRDMDEVTVTPYEYGFDGKSPITHVLLDQAGDDIVIPVSDLPALTRMLTDFEADVQKFNAALED